VTGLKAIQYGSLSLLLQGQGPFASVINTQNGQLLSKIRVFRRNNVHGFMIDESRRDEKANKIDILVWGGQSLRILSLSTNDGHHHHSVVLAHETAEYVAPDWVYDICASHVKDTMSLAYAITGHNSLLSVHLVNASDLSRYPKAIRLKRVAAGVKSTLYSANVLALSPSHILMAAGTVFGEIIVWSCFREWGVEGNVNTKSSIHHFFTGHDGSVFGVNISDEIGSADAEKPMRLLASCSDDRTVRIWDISDCFHITSADASAYQTDDGFALRSTGFGSTAPVNIAGGSEIAVAKEWGHISRIWGVYFLPIGENSPNTVNLVSRGEDATCQLWRLDLKPQPNREFRYDLRNLSILSHHVGKQIWSLSLAKKNDETVIYTGGGDGGVRVFELDYFGNSSKSINLPDHSPYNSRTMVKFANSRTNNGNLLKSFAFVSEDSLITVSDSGVVQVGKVDFSSCSKFQTKPQIVWQDIALEEDLRSVASIATLPRRGIALIGSGSRVIRLYDHRSKTLSEVTSVPLRPSRILILDLSDSSTPLQVVCFVVCYMKTDHVDLFYVEFGESENYETRRIRVSIPTSFEVTVATAFCHGKYLALGGKGGGLVVYKLGVQTDSLEYMFCDYKERKKNILRCILPIDDPDDPNTGYILSGGQNGSFFVHRLRQGTDEAAEIRLVHQAHTPFPHIEGAYFDATTGDLMLMGGKGISFILWNETTQTEVMVLDCGGARRVLDFMPNFDAPGSGIFAWNYQRALHVLVADSMPCRPPLRIGSHGRELKSVAVGYWSDGSSSKIPYIASVGEDTAIRISVPTDNNNWTPLRCLRVMTHHTTGLQQIQWSADGRFLFSSGGREEFFVWKIRRSVPKLGLAVLREGVCPRESFELELRIMSFDVLRLEANSAAGEERFLVALVYSNSTVKVC
jgi:WD40 repeat protein